VYVLAHLQIQKLHRIWPDGPYAVHILGKWRSQPMKKSKRISITMVVTWSVLSFRNRRVLDDRSMPDSQIAISGKTDEPKLSDRARKA
jgi:hypothetical protein